MLQQNNSVREQIAQTRNLPGSVMKGFQRRETVTELIITDLKQGGTFFRTPEPQFFYFEHGKAPRLHALNGDCVDLSALIQDRYGINSAERREYEHILVGLRNEAFSRGEEVQVHRLAHYARGSGILYVSRFDGFVYRLDGNHIQRFPNGTDGVFFWDDRRWQPYELLPGRVKAGGLDLITGSANFSEADGLSAADQQWLLKIWLYCQFFSTLHPTKPLLLIHGEKGGGKTLTLRKWLKALFGEAGEVAALERSKPDGFVAAVCSLPIAVFDNVDKQISWLPDHLAQLATGVSFKRRRLYTTNEEIEFRPTCYVALTSRTPDFIEGRDDVLDRTLILKTARRSQFTSEQELLGDIKRKRNQLWTELLRDLNKVVQFVRENKYETGPTAFRMADFASFALVVGRVQGNEARALGILKKLERRRTQMLLASEPIYVCLDGWLQDGANPARQVTSGELQQELARIAQAKGLIWPYSSAYSLGQRLANIRSNLCERFAVEMSADSAHQLRYRFWPKSESLSEPVSQLIATQPKNAL